MWKALTSFLKRPRPEEQSDPAYEDVKGLVEGVLSRDYSSLSERSALDGEVIDLLKRLEREIQNVREQANGYPDGEISIHVWTSGAGYANLCRKLTLHFRKSGWLHREENASSLWANATLAVCSHYRHLVGPAMLANADCQERLGNSARAAQMYRAVVADFELLLDWDYSDGPLDENERTALESLRTAARRLLQIGTNSDDETDKLRKLEAAADGLLE